MTLHRLLFKLFCIGAFVNGKISRVQSPPRRVSLAPHDHDVIEELGRM